MKTHFVPVFLLGICCSMLSGYAQTKANSFVSGQSRYNITYVTMDNGLLHNFIDDIYKDKQGFLWISTSGGGLSRYNGYEFVHYNTNTTRIKLKSNFIKEVCEDPFNRLWIASEGGIDILDLVSSKLVNMDGLDMLANHQVVSVHTDSRGAVWLYNGKALYKIRLDANGRIAQMFSLPDTPPNLITMVLRDVDNDGNIWAGLGNRLCKLTEDAGGKLKAVTIAPALKLDEGALILAFVLKENEIWMGTNRGLIRYDLNSKSLKWYTYDKNKENTLSQSYVTDLAVNENRQLMVCTLKGINIYNPLNDNFENISQENPSIHSRLNSNFVNCIRVDKDIVWIGTESGGLNKMTPKKLFTTNYIHNKDNPYSISEHPVNAVYEDAKGYLWVGTVEGGLNRKAPNSDKFTHYTAESSTRLSHNSVSSIIADNRNRLWVGTWGNGISILNMDHPERPAFQYISSQTHPEFNLDFIGSLCYDSLNNGIWIGCNPGIFFYDLNNNQLTFPFPDNAARKVSGVIGSVIDSCGRLWMGCMEGIYIINLRSRSKGVFSYRYLKYKLDDPASGVIEKISCFYRANDGTLWIGSNGYGIYKFIPDADFGKFVSYTTEQGLVSNNIRGILADHQGNLWISTNNGISCFNVETECFANYVMEDGLVGNQFYWNSYYAAKDGLLYFGGLEGLTVICPDRPAIREIPAKVVLTRLQVANKEIFPGDKYIHSDISIADKLLLHESDKSFSLEFSALNFDPATTYSYLLEGFDEHWIDVTADRRFASYTNLPPGKYTFKVKYNSKNTPQEAIPVAQLAIVVKPFFYKTAEFILICILLAIVSVYYLYLWRVRTLKNQKALLVRTVEERTSELEKQTQELSQQNDILIQQNEKITRQKAQLINMSKKIQELTTEKLAFFTNITHEFRTPITLITGPIERALKLSYNPQVIEQLHYVERNSKYLLSLVNQLMDFRKVEAGQMDIVKTKGDFIEFLNALLTPFEEFAKNSDIRILKYYRIPAPVIVFDSDALQKVITNLLSNAIKFTPAGGSISIYVFSFTNRETQKEQLYIGVKDTGAGIPEEDISKIFNRFYQSRNQIKSHAYGQSGTGIGLYLAKRIIQMLQGTITVRNNKKTGCTFSILLPLLRGSENKSKDFIVEQHDKQLTLPEPEVKNYFSPDKLSLLIVEDNNDMRNYIRSILESQYNILEAKNGMEAMTVLSGNNVDFVVSDLMMPVMDGMELSRKMKDNFAISHIPILMLTAKYAQESRIESYRIGVDEYLLKPFSEELLLTRINNILENRRRYHRQFAATMDVDVLQIEEKSSDRKFMDKVMEIIKNNYKNSHYESTDFVNAMGISKSLLNKKMQTLIGQSAGQFIRNYRLNIARQLIDKNRTTRNMNISEIAYEVGFNDPKYFTRCFTQRFNVTPSSLMEGK
ncbi:MAG: response regulator [Dysgonamonadaceae bacterium]|jgi:signal transduction histidine kinase/ligand-binding sensor domain-containing protein/CheY-like chemotaxis protein|nr:response regulator [Dysgonamonadaceae bacterium]